LQIIAKDTIEDKILEIQAKKNVLIQQAFAGNRTKETARQKKEARFNEIAALFGVNQNQGASSSSRSDNLVQQTL
jgi:SWI/SNF-related matrix-associated actin-dependent regulator of chromatin subfamily A3